MHLPSERNWTLWTRTFSAHLFFLWTFRIFQEHFHDFGTLGVDLSLCVCKLFWTIFTNLWWNKGRHVTFLDDPATELSRQWSSDPLTIFFCLQQKFAKFRYFKAKADPCSVGSFRFSFRDFGVVFYFLRNSAPQMKFSCKRIKQRISLKDFVARFTFTNVEFTLI